MPRWTPEARAKQREAIRQWRPWEKSTGPRTFEGKHVTALNGLKHGLRSRGYLAYLKRINELLRRVRGR